MNETDEQRERDAQDGFYTKPLWQRSLVIFAGPFMSFFFGYLVLCSIGLLSGYPTGTSNVIDAVQDGSIAQKIGLRADDKIVRIDSTAITNGMQMVDIIHKSIGKTLTLTVDRAGKDIVLTGAPQAKTIEDENGKSETVGIFGFQPRPSGYRHESLRTSFVGGNRIMAALFHMLGNMVQHHRLKEFRQNAGGPIYIATATAQAVKDGPGDVLLLAAQLSISLAIFNLLPIPILDGGHLLLFGIEGLRRGRRLTIEQQQNFMLAGLAIIGVLFVFIMFNDVWVRVLHHPIQ
jgi:regulator of sigma E protease